MKNRIIGNQTPPPAIVTVVSLSTLCKIAGHEALDSQIEAQENTNKTVVYAAVLGVGLQANIVFSQFW